jgi:ATP-dependent DNA ligase
MEIDKTLYKKDTKGKIRSLRISTDNGTLHQVSGLLDGAKVHHSSVSKPKNIGRANETTSEEQARLEAKSKIKKKLDEGYFDSIKKAEEQEVILPMLAKDFEKEKHKIVYPCFIQPKLDGMRALGNNGLTSRGGKSITTLKHIEKAIEDIDVILDGEIYAHGLSFQENMKIIKKYRKGQTEKVKYHVYDMISDEGYFERLWKLKDIITNIPELELVPTYYIESEEQIKEFHDKFVMEGYEGAIVRWGNESYKVKGRSSSLLKVKQFIDLALPILDVVPNDKNPEQGSFIFEWEGAKGHPLGDDIIGSGMSFSHEEREEMLTNKEDYIGKTAEVRFFEYSDTGVPRFPVSVGLRLDK